MSRIRVLYILDAFDGGARAGGTEGQLLELLAHLDRTRFLPEVAMFRPTPHTESAGAFPCPSRLLRIEKLLHPRAMLRLLGLARMIRHRRIRLVHVFLNDASVVAPFFCRLGGAQVIVSRRDMGFWYTPAVLAALRISNRFVNAIVTNSEAIRQNVHRREQFPLERMATPPDRPQFRRAVDGVTSLADRWRAWRPGTTS